MSEQAPFEFGQLVLYPEANSHSQERVACPVCFGNQKVVIILGNGDHEQIKCDYCFHYPGTVMEWRASSRVHALTIDGMELRDGVWWCRAGRFCVRSDELYTDAVVAEKVREALLGEAERRAAEMVLSMRASGKKKLTWSVGYHRKEIAEHRRKIEHHEHALLIAKSVSAPTKPRTNVAPTPEEASS